MYHRDGRDRRHPGDRRNHPWGDRREHLRRDDPGHRRHRGGHGHRREHLGGHHGLGQSRSGQTAAWASSPGWGEACPERHRSRRDAACDHREGRRDEEHRPHPQDGWGDAVACPCPGRVRTGCCPGEAHWDGGRGRGSAHRDAVPGRLLLAARAPACRCGGCSDAPVGWPASGSLAWHPASAREPHPAWAPGLQASQAWVLERQVARAWPE